MRKEARIFSIKAQGDSMYPLLQDGDTVEYVRTPFYDLRLNDIVLVYDEKILVTHRVIYKTKTTCITRGDNNAKADSTVQKGKVMAKVVRFKRKGIWHGIQDVYFAQSMFYLGEIQKVETILRSQKIPHVFLKGVLISLRYEGTIPKRIYADCDVLVQRTDFRQIEKAFTLLGYKILGQSLLFSKEKRENKPEVSYSKVVNGVLVMFDVHFEPVFLMTQLKGMNLLYPSGMLDRLGKRIIKRGETKKIKGFNYSLCSVPDQILYLALHIFHHNYTDSVRYQLLDAVIRKNGTKNAWNDVQNTIREYRLEGYVYLAFVLLKKYFKTPIPRSFLAAIRPSHLKFQISHFVAHHVDIFSQDSRTKAGIERFMLIFLLSPEPWRRKLLLFLHPEVFQMEAKLILSFFKKKSVYQS